MKERGARILIGEFYETSARHILCEAQKQGMTQAQGYVWFLPTWFQHDWYDIDTLRDDGMKKGKISPDSLPNCTTAQMVEVRPILVT